GKIKHWYNGYCFHHLAIGVYNPFSLLSLFLNQEFLNYWYTTGTPSFLMKLLKSKDYDLKNLTQFRIGEAAFEASESDEMEIQSVLVQTGYLTIRKYDGTLYTLGFPNYEVNKSFYDSLTASYGHLGKGAGQSFMVELTEHINAGRLEDFFTTLGCFFANIPYDLNVDLEKYYQSLFYAIFTLLGFNIEAEVHTNQGKIDCVLQTDDRIYIIEFKLNDTKEAAMQQIHDKQYAQKYQNSSKEVVLLGVEFNQKTRNIGEYLQVVL
ncbi:MAG: ATP-binding protein, partial [Psychrosphaera sp.]|nr:ATP-binding protein [Psychrosphaera sp.]